MRWIFTLKCLALTSALLLFASIHTPARAASDEDLRTLGMFYEVEDLEVTATRNPKPFSRTAENISVITSAEIEMMGAHTLADILNNVTGININDRWSVPTYSGITIKGSACTHILVMLDSVMLNFFSDFQGFAPRPLSGLEHLIGFQLLIQRRHLGPQPEV